ncbi:MAG: radical SAM protein [Phycisphaerales bacterium]|jgi:oxygen-independent coproporphyrinogen-3 oxidase
MFSKFVRWYLTGSESDYRFLPVRQPALDDIRQTNLYIHIPFCRSLCPYCPYNKIRYDSSLVRPYVDALLAEVELYYKKLGNIEVSSIYIGGGTPTLLIDQLPEVIEKICSCFKVNGDICIETNPDNIGVDTANKMKQMNVRLVSLGIQSFNDRLLKLIGRKYPSSILNPVIKQIIAQDFETVNADLIFALPQQSLDELRDDLQKAVDSGIEQITCYPLFTFPYTSVGKYRRLKKIAMPGLSRRFRHYRLIENFLYSAGYHRVSVWSYKKNGSARFSSVTRDGYIGFGAGATSHTPQAMTVNTFSVNEYIESCTVGRFATALQMNLNKKMQSYLWLYWRMYDTYISKAALNKEFSQNDTKLRQLLQLLRCLGMIEEDSDSYKLNDRGAFWIHLLQNYFALEHINKIWTIAKQAPWPGEIAL